MTVQDIINEIEQLQRIDIDKSFEYARYCAFCLSDEDLSKQDYAHRIIINILNNWYKLDKSTIEMWADLIESAGFYPYLEWKKADLSFMNPAGEIRKEYHKSRPLNIYFHEEQKKFYDILIKGKKNLILSAPTSFGKSLLIEEVVASNRYRNIVIIQPTLALLDETRLKLTKYHKNYKIIVRTSQQPSVDLGNLFLLTAERVMEYKYFPQRIDFFVIDEFYKLSSKRRNDRSDILNNAFNLLANKLGGKFYLLGPCVKDISPGFAQNYNAIFRRTNYSIVDASINNQYIQDWENRQATKEQELFNLLVKLKDKQTIIYCSSPQKVRYLSMKFCEFLVKWKADHLSVLDNDPEQLNIIQWIELNVDKRWGLIKCLNNKIGVHDGALQRHITASIMKYFNEKKLNYLFCTSTIIEGVNTNAENVVLFSDRKGKRKIDYFDYSNIKGRSGRLMEHFVGNVYNFEKIPPEKEIFVDIPFFEQPPDISDEILIQLDKNDIKNTNRDLLFELEKFSANEVRIFKENGLSVKGQIEILNILRKDFQEKYKLINWTSYPSKRQLRYILSLGWNHLLKREIKRDGETKIVETTVVSSLEQLVRITSDYSLKGLTLQQLIKQNAEFFRKLKRYEGMSDEQVFDDSIRYVFQVMRHWFSFKLPKWLNSINQLQRIVCLENRRAPGSYGFYALQLENDFIRQNLAILAEYGVPKSAINKIQRDLPSDINEEEVLEKLKNSDLLEKSELIEYEKQKIQDLLRSLLD